MYLEVTAKFNSAGRIVPISFIWAGRKINIDRVSDVRPAASLKHCIVMTVNGSLIKFDEL